MQVSVLYVILEALKFYKCSLNNRMCTLEDFTETLGTLVLLDVLIDEIWQIIESKED